jgi:hypothetical protein
MATDVGSWLGKVGLGTMPEPYGLVIWKEEGLYEELRGNAYSIILEQTPYRSVPCKSLKHSKMIILYNHWRWH